jgi:hypothetical protein
LFAASRNGEFSAVDPTLERLLGRPPMNFRDVLAGALPMGRRLSSKHLSQDTP